MKTLLAEGMRIQYNFVKPHMALKGKTPAQEAKLGVAKEKGNKWMDLLVFAKTNQTSKERKTA